MITEDKLRVLLNEQMKARDKWMYRAMLMSAALRSLGYKTDNVMQASADVLRNYIGKSGPEIIWCCQMGLSDLEMTCERLLARLEEAVRKQERMMIDAETHKSHLSRLLQQEGCGDDSDITASAQGAQSSAIISSWGASLIAQI